MKLNKLYVLIKSTVICIAISWNGVFAMGITDAGKVCLFSGMSGVVKLDGKPVAGARLVRTVNKEKDKTDETTTDESGYFEFKPIFDRTVTKFLPMEFVVKQVIWVHYKGLEYKMWSGVKRTEEENAESRGKPLIVECELSSERNLKEVNGSPIFSLCTWDAEPDPKVEMNFFN